MQILVIGIIGIGHPCLLLLKQVTEMNIKSVQNSVTVLLSDTSSMHKIFNALSDYTYTFYKQLGSGLSPQGC